MGGFFLNVKSVCETYNFNLSTKKYSLKGQNMAVK